MWSNVNCLSDHSLFTSKASTSTWNDLHEAEFNFMQKIFQPPNLGLILALPPFMTCSNTQIDFFAILRASFHKRWYKDQTLCSVCSLCICPPTNSKCISKFCAVHLCVYPNVPDIKKLFLICIFNAFLVLPPSLRFWKYAVGLVIPLLQSLTQSPPDLSLPW